MLRVENVTLQWYFHNNESKWNFIWLFRLNYFAIILSMFVSLVLQRSNSKGIFVYIHKKYDRCKVLSIVSKYMNHVIQQIVSHISSMSCFCQ